MSAGLFLEFHFRLQIIICVLSPAAGDRVILLVHRRQWRHRTLGWRDAALCTVTGACLLKDRKFAKKRSIFGFFFSTDASYDRAKSSKGLLTRSFALLVIVMHPTANNFQFMRVSHNNSQLIRDGGLAGKRLSYKQLIFQPITINFNLNFQHVAAAAAVSDM